MRLWVRRLLGAILLTTVAACADVPPGPDDSVATGAPLWGKTEVVEELRIGVEAGLAELMFGSVGSVVGGSDGTVYIADRQVPVIRVFDTKGTFLRNVGREGEGPGEYLGIAGLKILPNGRLVTWDPANRRVSIFSAAGEYVDSFRADSSMSRENNILAVDHTGNAYVRGVLRTPLPPGSAAARAASQGPQPVGLSGVLSVSLQPAYRKYSAEGELLDEIPLPAPDFEPQPGFVLNRASGLLHPFPAATSFCWSPLGYLVVGRNDTYRIDLQASEGAVSVTRDVAPVTVAAEEHANWEAWTDYLRGLSVQRGAPREYPPIPTTKPYFRNIYASEEGRIWVHRYAEAEKRDLPPRPDGDDRPLLTWLEPPTFDVFEPDGTFLGTVVLPHDIRVLALRGQRIWGVHTDDAGVERVVRFKIEEASE